MAEYHEITLEDGSEISVLLDAGNLSVSVKRDGKDIPLIYTTQGNVPYDDLRHDTAWEFGDTHISCVLSSARGEEVVRREPHVFVLEGLGVGGQTARMN